jgi:small GTP-binding protein
MWDTAGQEKYKSIAPIYYRDSQVALCVYDISSRASFDVLKSWVKELTTQGPKDLILAIVGNKTDKIDS